MAKLNKIASGLLLFEDFIVNSLLWTPSPNNYSHMEFNDKGLRIKHSDTYKTFTIQEPKDNYCFICKLNHIPLNKDDIGGVIVMSNDTSYLECQSYVANKHSYVTNQEAQDLIIKIIDDIIGQYVTYTIDDGTPSSGGSTSSGITLPTVENKTFEDIMYPYIKLIKKSGVYSFFASTDGIKWIEVGNSKLPDGHRLGFFLQSLELEEDSDIDIDKSNFYVEYAMFYDNNYVIIKNVKKNLLVELRDEFGNIILDSSMENISWRGNNVYIDTTLIKMPYDKVRLVILNHLNIIVDYDIKQLIGGDTYELGYDLGVFIDNVEINQEELFSLDGFDEHDQTIRIDIYNREEFEINDLKVSISAYSVYYGGNETIGISLYDSNEVNWNFKESVIIDSIMPSEGRSVLIKLTDKTIQDFYKKEGAFRFRLNIE